MTKSLPPLPLLKQDVYINFPQAQSYFCFALGSLFAAWRDKISPRYFWAIGIVLFALGMVGLNTQGIRYYGVMSIYVALFAFVMWLALVPKLPEIPKKFGDISYGVYLYAFPIQQLLSYYKVYEHGFVLYTALSVVISVIFALLSWRFVEKPVLRLKKC